MTLPYTIDMIARILVAHVFFSTNINICSYCNEKMRLTKFRPQFTARVDGAFTISPINSFLKHYFTSLNSAPVHYSGKNMIGRRHNIICFIFSKPSRVDSLPETDILLLRSISITHNLFLNNMVSWFDLAMVFTSPTVDDCLLNIPFYDII